MTRKQVLTLMFCMLVGTAILFILYAFSPLSKETYKGSFSRRFVPTEAPIERWVLDLKYNSYYLAGNDRRELYLANATAPLHLLRVGLETPDSTHISMKIVGLDSIISPGLLRLTIDSPYFHLMHGSMPTIFSGKINEWMARPVMPDSGYYFVEGVPMGDNKFALRSYSLDDKSYELVSKTAEPPYFQFKPELLNKQVDGMFCLDGKLHYSKQLGRLAYIHFYKDEIIIADSNFNLLQRAHTIDGFKKARISSTYIERTKQNMLTRPPMQVNALSYLYRDKIYIQSNVQGSNDDVEEFTSGHVIDIYNLYNGRYSKSFYLPKYKNIPASSFLIGGGFIAVIYGQYLVVYNLAT